MEEDKIRHILEELSTDQNMTEELFQKLMEEDGGLSKEDIENLVKHKELLLKDLMLYEKDWRKRAIIAAQIISNNL